MLFSSGSASAADSVTAGGAAESAAEEPPVMAAKKAEAEEADTGYNAPAESITESAVMDSMEAPVSTSGENGALAPEARKDAAASDGTLYGADQVYPTVMVDGALYEWHRGNAISFSGLPEGSEYYGAISHTDAETPTKDGEFASLFPVSGTIYTVPGDDTVVYLQLTTDWMEDTVVRFDRCG